MAPNMARHHRISQHLFYLLTAAVIVVALFCFFQAFSWINRPFAGFLAYQPPFAGSFSSKDWSGTQAGIRYLDRLETINGQPVQFGSQMPDQLEHVKPGTVVNYGIRSKGAPRTVNISVDVFKLKDFLLIFMVPFSVGARLNIGNRSVRGCRLASA